MLKIQEPSYKFGRTQDSIIRDSQHTKTFDIYKNIYRKECFNMTKVELKIKNNLRKLGLLIKINGQTEIFVLTSKTTGKKYTLEYIFKLFDKIIDKYPLPIIKEKDNKIRFLEDNNELKLKELNFKMSDNYKLELQFKKDIELKKLENEQLKLQIELKKLECK